MNTQRNTGEACVPKQTQILERFFFSPKTVEGQYLLSNFTQEMVPELRRFMHSFTEEDAKRILSCKNPKECLYTVAEIIGRIRRECPVSKKMSPVMEETVGQAVERFRGIL